MLTQWISKLKWLPAGIALCVIALPVVVSPSLQAQNRSAPGREGPPPRREDPPRRDNEPTPRRQDPLPRREDPPRREEPPRRDTAPAPRREEPPRAEPIPAPRRDEGQPGRTEPPVRSDDKPRFEPAPRRDGSPQPRRDEKPEQPTYSPRRDGGAQGPAPRRDEPGAGPLPPRERERGPADNQGMRRMPGDRSEGAPTRDHRSAFDRGQGRTPTPAEQNERYGIFRGRDLQGVPLGQSRAYREDPSPRRDRAYDLFTRSNEGRRYQHGIELRGAVRIEHPRLRIYFGNWDTCYFPYYAPVYQPTYVYYSPYAYYYEVCPPYVNRVVTYYRPPSVVYINLPIYVGNEYRGYRDDRRYDDYYLDQPSWRYDDRWREWGVDSAIRNIEEAFRYSDINLLAEVMDPSVRIGIFRSGKYEYSLSSNDYLDLTRDMMRTTDTLDFRVDRVQRRSDGVVVLSARHIYRGPGGQRRTVYLSFALERLYGRWIVTQIGTAPDRLQSL